MQPNCRTCGAELGALDDVGEEHPECIRCWLEPSRQQSLFGGPDVA